MNVSQLMIRRVETCRPSDSLQEAARRMWEEDVGCLPVLNAEGHVVGMVTDRDACMAAYTQGRPLDAMSVESAMANKIVSCLGGDSIEHAESLMKTNQVRRVPVIDVEGHLVGILTMNDIAREAARQLRRRSPDIGAGEFVTTFATVCEPRRPGEIMAAS